MALPVGTASVERSFSQMKLIKTRLRSRLSDLNLEHLMKIAIEGPPLTDIDFEEILSIFKEKYRRILVVMFFWGGGDPRSSRPLYETLTLPFTYISYSCCKLRVASPMRITGWALSGIEAKNDFILRYCI